MGFSRQQLLTFRDHEVPDMIGDDVRLLFVGINPGLWTAATGAHFAYPGNRFYPALFRAGIIDRVVNPGNGLSEKDVRFLTGRGIGITNIVPRATAKASELSRKELQAGGMALRENIRRWKPHVVAVAGVTAYRVAFSQPKASVGHQAEPLENVPLWVVPNPSGLNAHETVDSLAAAYAEPACEAGVLTL